MKKILLTLIGTVATAALVHAQGGLLSWNDLSAGITTNTALYGSGYPSTLGGTSGKISTWASGNHFYFALLTATTTNATDEGNPASGDWTVVMNGANASVGTNGAAAGAVAGDGGANGFTSSLNPSTLYYSMVVGWSASIGTSWSQVSAYFADGFTTVTGPGGYAGYSNIGTITPASISPAYPIFGGTGVSVGGLVLYQVGGTPPIPEPTTLALAGLGGLSMLLLRRRKT